MAETERNNLPVAEEPEFTTEIPAIRPDDPVHFAQMNAMLEGLLGNDVFLKRLANKMIENSLIAHVLDSENPQMVLGADQGPVITGLIDEVKEDVTQLYSEIQGMIIVERSSTSVTISSIGQAGDARFPYAEIPEGYVPFMYIPTSGTPNLLVANTQFSPISQWGNGFPVRYIGYQNGTWPIQLYSFYIKEGLLNNQT